MQNHFLSPMEFARRNGVSKVTVYRMLNRGELTARKLGRKTVIPVEVERDWRAALPAWQPSTHRK